MPKTSTTTLERSPSKRRGMITAAQKQALMDNLQLEITERARKLRAQYALRAQGLKARLEMRVHRIPQTLRETNIMELINKHSQQAAPRKPIEPAPVVVKPSIEAMPPPPRPRAGGKGKASPVPLKGVKRASIEMSMTSDKENAHAEDLSMPKKRAKTATASQPLPRATRTTSRKVNPSQVLSPKSNNSRTLPRSPLKDGNGLGKPNFMRPTSPIKPSVSAPPATSRTVAERPKPPPRTTSRAATATTTTTSTVRGKRAAPAAPAQPKGARGRIPSDGSNASDSSAGTTIVTKKGAPEVKRSVVGRAVAAANARIKQSEAAKKEAEPITGGRVLRTRR
ncbi:hypothetical protein M501DRAFT_996970 [Patellaria atrata CBS 101060]|uniref:Borealin N-terminal domain-containing protein n=1 Tax=Patellaria atrata CBS 101060 TaxID=1346257 RepID=A0A9P4S6L9_9PEZI|nr:hypothetical protein M501DRAFT_996970 [Patellaria atrata CBS 101060]